MNAYPVTISLFDDLPPAIEKPAKPERVRYVHHFRSEADNAPAPAAPVSAPVNDQQTIDAMMAFARALNEHGVGNRITTNGELDTEKCCLVANILLNRSMSHTPIPTIDDWGVVTSRVSFGFVLPEHFGFPVSESASKSFLALPCDAPDNAPVTAQDDNYVSQTVAMLQFCQEIKRRGLGEYLTRNGNVDYRQAARLCNAILGRAASDRPRPETHEWEIAAAYGLDRNIDRQLLSKLTPDCRKETA